MSNEWKCVCASAICIYIRIGIALSFRSACFLAADVKQMILSSVKFEEVFFFFFYKQLMRTIAVLGGGIGGLAASYYLCKIPSVAKVRTWPEGKTPLMIQEIVKKKEKEKKNTWEFFRRNGNVTWLHFRLQCNVNTHTFITQTLIPDPFI